MQKTLADLNPKIQQRLGLSLMEISEFCQQWQIVEMALFGSVLREDFHADSDIDILVKFAPKAPRQIIDSCQNQTRTGITLWAFGRYCAQTIYRKK